MLEALLDRSSPESADQLLKLYWNRAELKRNVDGLEEQLRQSRDQLKQQEARLLRAAEDAAVLTLAFFLKSAGTLAALVDRESPDLKHGPPVLRPVKGHDNPVEVYRLV